MPRNRIYQRIPLEERFWRYVEKSEGCWIWTGARQDFGYGVINSGGNKGPAKRTHRLSWELHYGPIPDGLFVCHHCDNPACVRPDHLFLGDNQANHDDMVRKGRASGGSPPGEQHPRAKLTFAKAAEIRHAYANGDANMPELAIKYGVSVQAIFSVVHNRRWREVA